MIPLSQYLSQLKCLEERLRWIVFDRTAILFAERNLDCTHCCNSPSIFVHLSSGCIQILLNFFIVTGVHRVHGCEEHGVPVPCETFSYRNQSTLDDGVDVVSVHDVVDVLGEVIQQ